MNELMEALERLAEDKVQIHCMKLIFTSHWSVMLEKKVDGVELKISAQADTLSDAIDDALNKWNRITGGVNEFKGQLITHTPVDFNDEVPF